MFTLVFCLRYGGALRLPPILTNSVEFINKCLLFIFFKKPLDFSFLLCYYIDIKESLSIKSLQIIKLY